MAARGKSVFLLIVAILVIGSTKASAFIGGCVDSPEYPQPSWRSSARLQRSLLCFRHAQIS